MAAPFSKVVFNAREELLTSDINRAQSLISRDLQDYLRDSGRAPAAPGAGLIYGDVNNLGGILNGTCKPPTLAASGTFDVVVGAGEGFLNDISIGGDDSTFQVLRWPQQTISLTTPDATNPRIDFIVAAPGTQNTDLESRNILLDPVARTVGQQSVPTTQNPLSVLSLVTGTPGATPAPPAVPAGTTVLFEIWVPASAVSSATFRPVRRMWQRATHPFCSLYGVLTGCELQMGGCPADESATDASAPTINGIVLFNRVVIDGEVLSWGPNLLTGATVDSSNSPFTTSASGTFDKPYYIYLCGGRNLPQFTLGSPAAPACLVESATAPSSQGYPSAAITTPRGVTQRGALFIGVGFTVAGTTKRKAVIYEGDWVRPKTGLMAVGNTSGGADISRMAAFNNTLGITLSTTTPVSCPISTAPVTATQMEVVALYSNSASSQVTVGQLSSGSTTVYAGAVLINGDTGSRQTSARFKADVNAPIYASGTADAGTGILHVAACGFNMSVPRFAP